MSTFSSLNYLFMDGRTSPVGLVIIMHEN